MGKFTFAWLPAGFFVWIGFAMGFAGATYWTYFLDPEHHDLASVLIEEEPIPGPFKLDRKPAGTKNQCQKKTN